MCCSPHRWYRRYATRHQDLMSININYFQNSTDHNVLRSNFDSAIQVVVGKLTKSNL